MWAARTSASSTGSIRPCRMETRSRSCRRWRGASQRASWRVASQRGSIEDPAWRPGSDACSVETVPLTQIGVGRLDPVAEVHVVAVEEPGARQTDSYAYARDVA